MKKLLLIITLILATTLLQAQPYQSVLADTFTVHTAEHHGLAISHIAFGFYGDTIVNNLSYTKVAPGYGGSFTQPFMGLVREDTMTGRVWYRAITPGTIDPANDTIDKLVMDMTLEKGDTFFFGKTGYTDSLLTVDTTYISNGRKIIEFNKKYPHGEPISFIEGVGTSMTLCYKGIHRLNIGYFQWLMLCAFKDHKLIYSSQRAVQYSNSCSILSTPSVDDTQPEITIHPNPSNGLFTATLTKNTHQLYVTTLNGQVILQKNISTNTKKVKLNLIGQPRGIYFLNLRTDKGTIHRKLVLE